MIRALLTFGINLVLAGIGLVLADNFSENVTAQASGFLLTVLIFSLAQAILAPFVFNVARKYASAVLGGIGIVSTLLALWVATLLTNGLSITGIGAWVEASLVVWAVTALGGWFFGWLIITRWWDKRQRDKQLRAAALAARDDSPKQ